MTAPNFTGNGDDEQDVTQDVAPESTDPHRVVSSGGRLLFEGTEADAQQYLRDNFPRVHVQPGSVNEPVPDAVHVAPNGTRYALLDGVNFTEVEQ